MSWHKKLSSYIPKGVSTLLLIATISLVVLLGVIDSSKNSRVAQAAGESLDSTFTANTGTGFKSYLAGTVSVVKVQSDGKILVGGDFTVYNNTNTKNIARLNSNGTIDTTFTTNIGTGFDVYVSAIAVQSDGKILVGGNFATFNGTTSNKIARLNPNGTIDTTFTTNIGTGFDNNIFSLSLQTDGKVIVTGTFLTFNSLTVNRIARLNTDGTIDTTFRTNTGTGFNNNTASVAIQSDGKIVVTGLFTSQNSVTSNRIARLNSDGTTDTTFRTNIGTGFNADTVAVAVQSDGKIVVGGNYTTHSGTASNRIGRLNADGTRDTAFTTAIGTGVNAIINSLAIQSDGKIIIAGSFVIFNSVSSSRVARLNTDGSRDVVFTTAIGTGFSDPIYSVMVQTDGQIVLGGNFFDYNGTPVNNIARIYVFDNSIDTTFKASIGTGFGANTTSQVIQTDQKIVVGGQFTTFNGITSNRIARLNTDGTIDTTFTAGLGTGFNGDVNALALQSDGKILVGGDFTTLNGVTSNRIARLNTDGTPDTAFTTGIGAGFNVIVNTVIVQGDGKIVVGGQFTTHDGTASNRIARLNTDGTRDTSFTTAIGAGFNGTVTSLALQSDQKIVVGGDFTTHDGTTSNRIGRLTTTGARDTAFTTAIGTGFNVIVNAVIVQSDQKIVVGGDFTTHSSTASNRIGRLTTTGARDTAFTTAIGTGFNVVVYSLSLQSDQKILVGGNFTTQGGTASNRIGRLTTTGARDTAFTTTIGSGLSGSATSLNTQSDGKIVVGGQFTTFNGNAFNRIARFNPSGVVDNTLDNTLNVNVGVGFRGVSAAANIYSALPLSSGSIIVAGNLNYFNGANINHIAKLNSSGTLDTTFKTNIGTGFNNTVRTVGIQTDGKIVVGGNFTSFNGTTTNRIARLNADGTLDTTFTTSNGTGFNDYTQTLAIQTDGKIVVGGNQITFNGTTVNRITRLNSDGTLDTSFRTNTGTGVNDNIFVSVIQTDGKIVLGGYFTTFNGTTTNRIARLNTDGTLDTAFITAIGTAANTHIESMLLQPDGKILIGGQFTTFNGTTTNRIARLNTGGTLDTTFTTNTGTGFGTTSVLSIAMQSDGKILVGGDFTTLNGATANRIARLNSDGTPDTAFTTTSGVAANALIRSLAVQTDGKIILGGTFTSFDTITTGSIARLGTSPVSLSLKLFLSSNYNTGTSFMTTSLNTSGIIPTSQPYNTSPFSYSGTETIGGTIGANVVDWILVEIRDSARTTVLERQAALLMKDGTVYTASTQTSGITLASVTTSGNYYIIIRHRNHLAISTGAAVSLTPGATATIDYSTNSSVLGSNQTLLATGVYGMKKGNANGDSSIDATDRSLVRTGNESSGIYSNKDLNLDTRISATDRFNARNTSDVTDGI